MLKMNLHQCCKDAVKMFLGWEEGEFWIRVVWEVDKKNAKKKSLREAGDESNFIKGGRR